MHVVEKRFSQHVLMWATLSIVSKCRITLASGAMRSVDAQVCWCSNVWCSCDLGYKGMARNAKYISLAYTCS